MVYRVLDRRAKKGFLLRWTFVLCTVSFALLVQSNTSHAKVQDVNGDEFAEFDLDEEEFEVVKKKEEDKWTKDQKTEKEKGERRRRRRRRTGGGDKEVPRGFDSPTKPTRFERIPLSGPKKEKFSTVLPLFIPERFPKSAFQPKERSLQRGFQRLKPRGAIHQYLRIMLNSDS
jgi:hypothetical protein